MNLNISLEDFLIRNNITKDLWRASDCTWEELIAIAKDHKKNQTILLQSADFFAKLIQQFQAVHSVRWRIKDAEHLIEKIVRKRALGVEKYLGLTLENYFTIVTDLVGIRALHLFKDECFLIDGALRENWLPIEDPIAYTRAGDDKDFLEKLERQGFDIKSHPAGYRSVHYVFESQPLARKIIMEVQVRTIFEEGWSEIDHKVRYPNFSDNHLVNYLLTIFNRMAGAADEMGGFVKGLATALGDYDSKVLTANDEKEKSLAAMDEALSELANAKQQTQESQKSILKLKQEIDNLKSQSSDKTASEAEPWVILLREIVKNSNNQKRIIEKKSLK